MAHNSDTKNSEIVEEYESIDGVHMGKNFKKLRMAARVKQEVIAQALSKSQQSITRLEERAVIDDGTLAIITPLIGCSVEIVKNLRDDTPPERLYQFFDSSSQVFNPLEALMEQFEKTQDLYERMLKDKDGSSELLQRIIDKYLTSKE